MSNVYPFGFGQGLARTEFNSFGADTVSMDSSNDKLGWIFQAHAALTITRLGIATNSTGGAGGTSPTYRVSLQSVSAGVPTGTILGGGSPASGTGTLSDGGWTWITLSNSYACTRGQLLALVLDYSSGTIDGSHYRSVIRGVGSPGVPCNFPIAVDNLDGAGWNKQVFQPTFGYGTAGAKFGYLAYTATTIPTSGTGNRVALKFTIPSGFGNTFQIAGFRICANFPSGEDVKIGLWDGGTELQSVTFTGGNDGFGGDTNYAPHEFYFDETTLSTLNYGSTYYIGVEQLDASDIEVAALVIDDPTPFPYGANGFLATYNGAWGDSTERMPFIGLILEDTTPPGGSGGGLRLAGHGGLAS